MSEVPALATRNRERRFFGVLRESPAFHFYLLQLCAFLYVIWRFASRNYTVYGFLPDEAFGFPRGHLNELLPIPAVYFTTFQFVYELVPRPGPETIKLLQGIVIGSAGLGLVGLLPRWNALLCFLLGVHMTGWIQATNADMDGGSQLLWLLLILALSPSSNFYGLGNGFRPLRRSKEHHWPLFLLFLVVSLYYSFSGLGKFVDVGADWIFRVHLDRLAEAAVEGSLFVAMPYTNAEVAGIGLGYPASVAFALVALLGETLFLAILWFPRYRPTLVVTMITLHVMVLMLQGLNFLGNAVVLCLCLDWNSLVRRATVLYDGDCGFCTATIEKVRVLDWFKRLDFVPISESSAAAHRVSPAALANEMGLVDENGEVYFGADAFEQLAARTPLLWPFALLMKVPGAIYVARPVYRRIARHRMHTACGLEGS